MMLKRKCNAILFYILLFFVTVILLKLFAYFTQLGDYPFHLAFVKALIGSESTEIGIPRQVVTYPLYHICVDIVKVIANIPYRSASIIVLTASELITIILIRFIALKYLVENEKISLWVYFVIDFVCLTSIFIEDVYGWLVEYRFYAKQCGPNPWHNPTYIFSRPIGLLVIIFCISFLNKYELHKEKFVDCFALSTILVVSILSKPSFCIIFLPAIGVYSIRYFIDDYDKRQLYYIRLIAIVLVPLLLLLWQFLFQGNMSVGTPDEVGVHYGGFSDFNTIEIFKVCLATFPITIICIAADLIKKRSGTLIIELIKIMILFGTIEMFFMTNGPHGDFSWGYDISVWICETLFTIETLLNRKGILKSVVMLIWSLHTIFGIIYIYNIMINGGNFWI